MHAAHAAPAEHERAFHPGGPGADDQHVQVGVGGPLEALGVPASAVLLAGGRVLGADELRADDVPGRADVAPDALPDLVGAALFDLPGEEGIGDGRPGSADEVELAGPDDVDHDVGSRETAGADDGLRCMALHLAQPVGLIVLGVEARGPGVPAPVGQTAHLDVPEIDQRVGDLNEGACLVEPEVALAPIDRDARRDRAVSAHGVANLLEALDPEARAVLEGAAVLVRAAVVARQEELRGRFVGAAVHVRRCRSRRPARGGRLPRRTPGARRSPPGSSREASSRTIRRRRSATARAERPESRSRSRARPCSRARRRREPRADGRPRRFARGCGRRRRPRAGRRPAASSRTRGAPSTPRCRRAAHPPSAFTSRSAACIPGRSDPAPLQWGTW